MYTTGRPGSGRPVVYYTHMEGPKFSSPQEEIAYLRKQIAEREQEILRSDVEAPGGTLSQIERREIERYRDVPKEEVLSETHALDDDALLASAERINAAQDQVAEILSLADEKGIKNALSVVEKMKSAHLVDEVHRELVEYIKSGKLISGLKEGVPPWRVLHTTLFEVTLPEFRKEVNQGKTLSELIALMEQFYSGMQGVGYGKGKDHYTLEIAVANKSDDIIFYVAVPDEFISLFEKQLLSLFPTAVLFVEQHDYNIFVERGVSLVAEASLKRHPVYPLRTKSTFENDPVAVLLNAFSKIEKEGGGAALQLVVKSTPRRREEQYEQIIKRIEKGMKVSDALARDSFSGEMLSTIKDALFSSNKKEADERTQEVDTKAIEVMREKLTAPIVDINLRIVASAGSEMRAKQILHEIESTFNQFERIDGNRIVWKLAKGRAERKSLKAFAFREFSSQHTLPLSLTEIATLFHFPGEGTESSPQFKQSSAKTAPAPTEMPDSGTLLGLNKHRGVEKKIYVTPEDRLRHMYIIGQTGTGKSVFMKNLIIQDINAGHGVCMIDPHGTDIEDVLAAIPPGRIDDVIYFDPANLDHVVALNMLEYDPQRPEQKTFVVNELFSIFQKLYGDNPESMGPMFEQYFRNATLLVMEDPESGNTLMDISRVMSDASYRRLKLSKCQNPVVKQFWTEIASKAGGEASLENIVPYIVSKFDVFTANDYMRPIIGQQKSSFNFRQIMDERKILLVNLSKGRLGDINANLIGMIVVGKLLMAALSRVDIRGGAFPPFYLHIDEFQNVSTPSIASILSEARKYKLGLTIAHQFIAQLDENIKDAVFGNVGSMAAFRVGPEDGEFLAHQFAPVFDARDLINVPNYNAYAKILADGTPTRPFSLVALPPPVVDGDFMEEMLAHSLMRYSRTRSEVEAEIEARYQKPAPQTREVGGIL